MSYLKGYAEKHQIMSSDSGEIQTCQDTVNQEPGTAFFLELGGKLFSSINADFQINQTGLVLEFIQV